MWPKIMPITYFEILYGCKEVRIGGVLCWVCKIVKFFFPLIGSYVFASPKLRA